MKYLFSQKGSFEVSAPLPKSKRPKDDDQKPAAKSGGKYQLHPDRFWIVLTVGLSNIFNQMQFSAYPISIKFVAKYYQQVHTNFN